MLEIKFSSYLAFLFSFREMTLKLVLYWVEYTES